ncbi:amino acid permease-domain-containing protein [Hyaloraphidium curvatum]|nr:amino acid permease-domain-containing protein [Hyaloraphidium curvatum]
MADSPTLAPSRTNRRVRSQRTFEEHYRDLRRADSNTSSLFPDGRRESELPGRAKLGTFAGVFVPTILSIWGVLYYLRFGYVVGQGGVVGTLLVWAAAHVVSIVTALSLSAICTAGVVKTGGVYYILSRVLGPEFGGSLGVYLVLSNVLSAALAALAFVESLLDNFGSANGGFLPDGRWWTLLYATILNFASAAVCFVGADSFAKTSVFLATILLVSTLSCYATFLFRAPFQNPEMHLNFTGIRMETLESNLWPDFHPDDEGNPVGYTTLFGLLFPIVAGVLSGASLSGDLESPSKSIPRGTLSAIAFTLFIYVTTTFLLASTVTRASLLKDLSVVVDANFFPATVTAGLLATSIFACLGSIISAAKAWQALARDHLIPGISVFAYGDLTNDEPHLATAFCTLLTQLLLMTVTDINVLAPLVTITNLILFSGVNLAVALLKLASAPNFRPSFRYFSFGQALFGTVACIVAIVLVDPGYGLVSILIEIVLFFVIAYSAAPKPWGDVSQGIIFHQVRKYLLQLDLNRTHTKFWRPQILLCVDTPLKDVNLVKFGNQLKKGGLYVLAHVYPTEDFRGTVAALQDVNYTWLKYVEQLHVKAFVELSSAPTVRLGIQSLMMTAGLGTL